MLEYTVYSKEPVEAGYANTSNGCLSQVDFDPLNWVDLDLLPRHRTPSVIEHTRACLEESCLELVRPPQSSLILSYPHIVRELECMNAPSVGAETRFSFFLERGTGLERELSPDLARRQTKHHPSPRSYSPNSQPPRSPAQQFQVGQPEPPFLLPLSRRWGDRSPAQKDRANKGCQKPPSSPSPPLKPHLALPKGLPSGFVLAGPAVATSRPRPPAVLTSKPLPSCFPPASTGAASLPPPPLPPRGPTCVALSQSPFFGTGIPLRSAPAARMAATTGSLEAVKRKIQALQQEADEAEDRAQVLQRQRDQERELREKVSIDSGGKAPGGASLSRPPPRALLPFLRFLACFPPLSPHPRPPPNMSFARIRQGWRTGGRGWSQPGYRFAFHVCQGGTAVSLSSPFSSCIAGSAAHSALATVLSSLAFLRRFAPQISAGEGPERQEAASPWLGFSGSR